MVNFASLEFLFRFLPIFFTIYFLIPAKHKDVFLLVGSLFFYAMGDPVFFPVLLIATTFNYYWGKQIWKLRSGDKIHKWQEKERKKYMIKAVILDVLLLVVFKILGTFVDQALLPLGISFFTFQQLSYVIDRMNGKAPHYDIVEYMSFVTFFPQLIAGPIVLHSELIPQFRDLEKRKFNNYFKLCFCYH